MMTRAAILRIVPFLAKLVVFFFLVSVLPLPHRYLADSSTEKELTFAMIKPDGISGNHTDSIRKLIVESGFTIVEEELAQLDEDTARNFYAEHSSKSFFESLVHYVTSIRAMCGLDLQRNCVHGSDSRQSAAREISFFFNSSSPGLISLHDEL